MITPSKFTPLEKSVIFKMIYLLEPEFHGKEMKIVELYRKVEKKFTGIDEFIYSIDILYILGYADVDFARGVLRYAHRDNM